MIDNLIMSLILMFVSGLTIIAYKQPELYQDKFFNQLAISVGLMFIGTMIWDMAIYNLYDMLLEYFKGDALVKAKEAKEGVKVKKYIFYGLIAIYIYNFFLSWLAYHMKQTLKKDK